MITIGVLGTLAGLAAIVVGQTLVRQAETSVDDSLVVTTKALSAVSDSIAVTGTIVDTIRDGVVSVGTTLTSVRSAIDDSSTTITDTGEFLGGSLPDSVDAINKALPTIEGIANSIDSALRTLSRAPFGPNYNPDQPFDEAIADLSTALKPIPEQLRTLSTDFIGLDASTARISASLKTLGGDIVKLQSQLDSVTTLVARYSATAAEATAIAASSRRDLHDSASSTRLLLIVLGLVFIAGQIVPIWLGAVLLGTEQGNVLLALHHDTPHPEERVAQASVLKPPMRAPDPGGRLD